jgi:ribonuclease HI
VVEYRDERDLNVYTDGSSYSGPRRGGIGILYVTVDENGEEKVDDYPLSGYAGATNQQMEISAAIEALKALVHGRAPVSADGFRRIVIWTDSMYLVDGFKSARFSWPQNRWMTRDGNPVRNAPLWKELVRVAGRAHRRVDIEWVKGHKSSTHNKAADRLARASAKQPTDRRVSTVKVRRRKQTTRSVERGSVEMRGQRATIHIVTDEYLSVQRLNAYKYEMLSRGEFKGNVDQIYSEPDIYLSAGHSYYVRFNADTKAPRVVKLFREVDPR